MPDVKSYLDVYLFLQDYYEERKAQREGFSYEQWALELDVPSRSFLRYAIHGERKISEELTQKLCDYLKFSDEDREYFVLLVLYTQCTQPSQKSIYGRKLTQALRRVHQTQEISLQDAIVACPLHIVVRNILSFSDIEKTPAFIAKILGMTEAEVQAVLLKLAEAGAAEEVDGVWQSVHNFIKVGDKPGSQALLSYHRICLEKAIAAQTRPASERHYRGLNIAFTAEEYKNYLSDLNDFVAQVVGKYDGEQLGTRRIYQINFNLFPWTEEFAKDL